MRVRLLALLAAECIAQSNAQAQQTAPGPAAPGVQAAVPAAPPQMRRWSVILDWGGTKGGPGGDIEDAMRTVGLDQAFGTTTYPRSQSGDESRFLVEAQCRIREPWSVGVLLGRSMSGSTTGSGPGLALLNVNYGVTSYAAMLSAGPPSIQIGLGPALHRARSRPGIVGDGQPWSDHWKVGFIAQAQAMAPARSRIFLGLTAQYSFVGSVVVGPYTAPGLGPPVTFPPTSVQYNHWFIGFGPGVRF
jgi:hypothetical protein